MSDLFKMIMKHLNGILLRNIIDNYSMRLFHRKMTSLNLHPVVSGEGFGHSISLSNERTLAIGAPTNDDNGTRRSVVLIYE